VSNPLYTVITPSLADVSPLATVDEGDSLAAAAVQLDALQSRCNEALEIAKRAQAQVIATHQLLTQHVARVRGLLVQAGNARKAGR
jgi:hypothetical protein